MLDSLVSNNNKQIWYLILSTITIYAFSSASITIASIVVLLLVIIGYCLSPIMPLCIWLSASLLSITILPQAELVIWFVATIPYFIKKREYPKKQLLFLAFCIFTIMMSIITGIDPNINSGVIQVFVLLCYLIVIDEDGDDNRNLIIVSLLSSGLVIGGVTVIQLIQGTASYHYKRLTYNDNIRDLANAITFPVFWFFSSFMDTKKEYKTGNRKVKLLASLLIFVALLIVLLLTGSRGNILAFVMAVSVYFIVEMREFDIKKVLSAFVLTTVAVVALFSMNLDFAMLSDTGSADARFEIWNFYFSELFGKGPIRAIFGFGPGILKRVAAGTIYSNRYAHSTLFDYVFTYGICGLFIICYMIHKVAMLIMKSKNAFLIGLTVLVIFMYAPFGTCRDLLFHVLIGICCCKNIDNRKKEIGNEQTKALVA